MNMESQMILLIIWEGSEIHKTNQTETGCNSKVSTYISPMSVGNLTWYKDHTLLAQSDTNYFSWSLEQKPWDTLRYHLTPLKQA